MWFHKMLTSNRKPLKKDLAKQTVLEAAQKTVQLYGRACLWLKAVCSEQVAVDSEVAAAFYCFLSHKKYKALHTCLRKVLYAEK